MQEREQKEEYLKNEFCSFEPLTKIDFNVKKKLLVTSLFRMKQGGYRDFTQYLNGIKKLDEIAKKKRFNIRIFIDKTIRDDQKTMEYLISLETVSIILYQCPTFWMDDHHVSVFGTMVRFFPMFKFPNNDSKLSIMVDADTNEEYVYSLIETYDILRKKRLHKQMYLVFMGNFFHRSQKKMKEYEYNGKKIYFPYFLAQKLLSVKKIPKKPLVKFIKKMNEYMNTRSKDRPTNILTDYEIDQNKKEFMMCYRIKYNLLNYYTNLHPTYVKENKRIFFDYLKRFDIQDMDVNKVRYNVNFLEMNGKKIINMIETLELEKDYRIFLKPYIYSMKSLDMYHKMYTKIDYFHFFGQNDTKQNVMEQIDIISAS